MNPLIELENFGQSVWLDYISRPFLAEGGLLRSIREDHLKGVTSNPSIFEKAITKTTDYDRDIELLNLKGANDAKMVYENLVIKDIREACDFLRSTYESKKGADGFVSLEVSPHLALEPSATLEEAQRLWHEVDRPNLMIKVPGTKEGMKAIRALIKDGINVNVTLLFSVGHYKLAAESYLLGLKDRSEKGLPIDSVHSVASFFISRIDSKIDPLLEQIKRESNDQNQILLVENIIGKVAIANAKMAYRQFQELYQSDEAKALIRKGAHCQRLLWASTSTKNKNYSDVLYVESLMASGTVNTLPIETYNAFKDHGKVNNSFLANLHKADEIFSILKSLSIDFDKVCQELLEEGIQIFTSSFDQLLDSLDKKLLVSSSHKE